jgi:type VI secretion system secreted protein VgrG
MNKHNHEPGNGPKARKRFGAKRWLRRFVSVQVRQPLTKGVTFVLLVALLVGSVFFVRGGDAWARPLRATAPGLGTATSFAVLAASTVTNAGAVGTIVTGDLGVSPGSAVTGFPPGVVVGTIHAADAVAAQAQADALVAYNNLAGQACDTNLTSQDLGGLTLTPGVYCFASSAQLSGILTLDGQGDPNAVFVFQIGSTLTTASASSVLLTNGASACNVFWQIGSSATLGTGTSFNGNLLAFTSITLTSNASIAGRALAQSGAVTLDTNPILASCTVGVPTPTSTSNPAPTNTNTPAPTSTTSPIATNTSTPDATSSITPTATPGANGTATPTTLPTQTNVPTGLDPEDEPLGNQPSTVYLPLTSQ